MWGKESTFENLDLKLFHPINSEEGCSEYSKPPKIEGKFAFFVTGLDSCPFGNLVHNAQNAEASALFIHYPRGEDINHMTIPSAISGIDIL